MENSHFQQPLVQALEGDHVESLNIICGNSLLIQISEKIGIADRKFVEVVEKLKRDIRFSAAYRELSMCSYRGFEVLYVIYLNKKACRIQSRYLLADNQLRIHSQQKHRTSNMAWRLPEWIWSPPSSCSGTFEWVEERDGRVPSRAVLAGVDLDGGEIFVGRAWESDDLLPAKVTPKHRCAFVSYAGRQVEKDYYQVLVSDHIGWKSTTGGNIPPEAIRIGHTNTGEPLYMGRTLHEGTLTPGKVHPSHGCLYIAWSGEELKKFDYEIMVLC